mgnify:FL=1
MARSLVLLVMITSCATPPSVEPTKIRDINGSTHFYTLRRVTNIGETVRYCELHYQWEYIKKYNTSYKMSKNLSGSAN